MRRVLPFSAATLSLVLIFGGTAAGQAAASQSFFLPAAIATPGGTCNSSSFRLQLSIGDGVGRCSSASFVIVGGYSGALDAPTTGRPWFTAAVPAIGPLLGGSAHRLVGTEFDLGPTTSVTIGGAPATVGSRGPDHVDVTLPAFAAPGWKDVTVANAGGTTTAPKSFGVLPMTELPRPVASGVPFRVTYRGTVGDIFYFAVSGAKLPIAVPIAPYRHGLELNPGTLLGLLGPFPVTNPSGEFHFDFPGIPLSAPIYVQMLGLGSPGYSPGSFTNVIKL